MNVNIDKLIQVVGLDNAGVILDILGIDLRSTGCHYSVKMEWKCEVEKVWWAIEARQLRLSECYSVRWTTTVEAGVDDVEIVEHFDGYEDNRQNLGEWLSDIAAQVGSSSGNVRMVG